MENLQKYSDQYQIRIILFHIRLENIFLQLWIQLSKFFFIIVAIFIVFRNVGLQTQT